MPEQIEDGTTAVIAQIVQARGRQGCQYLGFRCSHANMTFPHRCTRVATVSGLPRCSAIVASVPILLQLCARASFPVCDDHAPFASVQLLRDIILPRVVQLRQVSRQHAHREQHYQNEPVEVHQEQDGQETVDDEEVGREDLPLEEARRRHVHHLPWEVVQPSDEPSDSKAGKRSSSEVVVCRVEASPPHFEVHIQLGELEQHVRQVMQDQHQHSNVVAPGNMGHP